VKKEILISARQGETRAAVLEDGELVEIYFERPVNQRLVGNIYKGRVENVLPGMQASFVNIGLERNAFLYVDDAVLPEHANGDEDEEVTESLPHNVTIKDVLRVNQDIVVQVAKEPMGQKGRDYANQVTPRVYFGSLNKRRTLHQTALPRLPSDSKAYAQWQEYLPLILRAQYQPRLRYDASHPSASVLTLKGNVSIS
jgi:hypothetical protein